MSFTSRIPMRVIIPGVMLACLTVTSTAYGFDTRFASGKGPLAIPFELQDNQIFLHVSVNASPPLSFVLDTGAPYHLLSLRFAQSFGLSLQHLGKEKAGVGNQPTDWYFVTDKVSLSLPGVVLSDQWLLATSFDIPPECGDQRVKEGTGRVMEGVLGKGLFDSFVVEIDYAARLINLHNPQSYQ